MDTEVFYGHIDKVEPIDKEFYMEFHCLTQTFADRFLNDSPTDFQGAIRENQDQVIILQGNRIDLETIFKFEKLEETESEWVILQTNRRQQGQEASYFIENAAQPNLYISSISRFSPASPILDLLQKQVSLDNFVDSSEDQIKSLMEKGNQDAGEFIAVYNVGQGNSNAVCDIQGRPMFYFDLGGGCYKNAHTYPRSIDYCFTHSPSILLSHWDTDHFQSARLNRAYLKENWIVPKQKMGPIHFKFFLSITGTKLIWPKSLPHIRFQWGHIEWCTGPIRYKNHSGLAFSVNLSPSINQIRNVLLPADAAYTYIPSTYYNNYDGIVITHHGAEFDNNNNPVPLPGNFGANAFSYGRQNSYGHPKRISVRAHINGGWIRNHRRRTIYGHIAMTSDPAIPIGCRGHGCQLQITQTF